HQQFHFFRSAECDHGIQRGANGAPRIEDVINQYNFFSFDEKRNEGFTDFGRDFTPTEIVAMKGGVQVAQGDLNTRIFIQFLFDSFGEKYPPWLKPQEHSMLKIPVIFDQFLANAINGEGKEVRIKNELFLHAGLTNIA